MVGSKSLSVSGTTSYDINLPSTGFFLIYATSSSIARCWAAIVITYSGGAAYILEIAKGSGVTLTAGTNAITVTTTSTGAAAVNVFSHNADKLSDVSVS